MTSKNICGYVQSLSPTKKSRTCQPYFHFNLQTGETKTQRVVCFDNKLRPNFQTYQTSKAPVKINNASEKWSRDSPDVLDIFIGKRAKAEAASSTEVPFLFHPVEPEQIIKATAADLQLIEPGQLVTVDGRITMDVAYVQEIHSNQQPVMCLERAIITDATGSFPLTLWGDLIGALENGKAYVFSLLRVTIFQEVKRLSTTPSTTATNSDTDHPLADESTMANMFDNQGELFVETSELAENFHKWYSCKRCHKRLTDALGQIVVACPSCKAVQRPSTCPTKCSIRIIFNVAHETHSLLAHRDLLHTLLEKYNSEVDTNVTLNSADDEIYLAVLSVPAFTVSYNKSTSVIESVTF